MLSAHWDSQRSPGPLAVFRGLPLRNGGKGSGGMEGIRGRGGNGRERVRRGREF